MAQMRRARFFPGKLIYDHKGSCITGRTTNTILKHESKKDVDGMGIGREVLGATAFPGRRQTRQVLLLAAARNRTVLLSKMCTLGELTQQPSSGTRCLHSPLRTHMTIDEDVPT